MIFCEWIKSMLNINQPLDKKLKTNHITKITQDIHPGISSSTTSRAIKSITHALTPR